jgi:hypothetical protein
VDTRALSARTPTLRPSRPAPWRQIKITFAKMRDQGVRGILIYCADYRCSHSLAISGDRWPDDLRLSERDEGIWLHRARRRRAGRVRPHLCS